MQEQEGEDRIVAKSKPTAMNLTFIVSTSSSTEEKLVASKSPEILKAPCPTDWSSTGKLDAKNTIKTQRRVLKDGKKDAVLDVGTRKLVATEEETGTPEIS